MDMEVPTSATGSPDRISPDEIKRQIEADPTLVPTRRSALLVEPAVLDPAELDALLADLGPELLAAMNGVQLDSGVNEAASMNGAFVNVASVNAACSNASATLASAMLA